MVPGGSQRKYNYFPILSHFPTKKIIFVFILIHTKSHLWPRTMRVLVDLMENIIWCMTKHSRQEDWNDYSKKLWHSISRKYNAFRTEIINYNAINIINTTLPGISVTAPIRRGTPWALIKKKIPFKRPWALPKIKIYVFCSVCRNFMQYYGMLSKHILMISRGEPCSF